jgi:hypothetical protein
MTYGSNEKGEATFTLTLTEHKAFTNGEPIVKKTGDSKGDIIITLQLTRPLFPKEGKFNPIDFANRIARAYPNLKECYVIFIESEAERSLTLAVVEDPQNGQALAQWDTGANEYADRTPYFPYRTALVKRLNQLGIKVKRT